MEEKEKKSKRYVEFIAKFLLIGVIVFVICAALYRKVFGF